MAKAMKRAYKAVDMTALTPKEKKAYQKRLAYVRKYTQAKREWQKRIKAGKLDPKITLDQFRGATRGGHGKAVADKAKMVEAVVNTPNPNGVAGADVLVSKLQRLITEIQHMDRKRASLADIIEKLGA